MACHDREGKKLEAASHIHNQEERKNKCMCAVTQLVCLLHSQNAESSD